MIQYCEIRIFRIANQNIILFRIDNWNKQTQLDYQNVRKARQFWVEIYNTFIYIDLTIDMIGGLEIYESFNNINQILRFIQILFVLYNSKNT